MVFPRIVALAFLAGGAQAAEVNLTVNEMAGVGRTGEWIASGVPFREGLVRSVGELSLETSGASVEAQFMPTAYWHDGSIRWALSIFKTDLAAKGGKKFTLKTGAPATAGTGLAVSNANRVITVATGLIKVEMDAKAFNLFNRVWLDKNGNGAYEDAELMVSPSPENGARVVHRDSKAAHFSSLGEVSRVYLEESGPLRACVVVEGTHKAAANGVPDGMYDYLDRIYFHKGSGRIRVVHTIKNGRPPSKSGNKAAVIPALSYSLAQRVNLSGVVNYAVPGATPLQGPLDDNDKITIYQGGDGSDCWNNACNQGFAEQAAIIYAQNKYPFRGYRVLKNGTVLQEGDLPAGFLDVSDATWGVSVGVAHFGNLFPISLSVDGDGRIFAGFWPEEYAGSKWMPYLMTKTYEVTYDFHAAARTPAALLEIAKAVERPLMAVAEPAYLSATHAMDGEFFNLETYRFPSLTQTPAEFFLDPAPDAQAKWKGMENGWPYFNWARGQWYGNMHGASAQMQPQVYRYFLSLGKSYYELEKLRAYAEHTRDVRRWHIDNILVGAKQDAGYKDAMTIIFGSREGFPDMKYTYPDGLGDGSTSFGWNMNFLDPITSGVQDRGHGGMYQLLENYYVTGDQRSAEAFGERIHINNALSYYGFEDDTRMAGFFLNDVARYASVRNPAEPEAKAVKAGMELHLQRIMDRLIEMRVGVISRVGPDCGSGIERQDTHEKPYMLSKLIMGAYEAWRLHRNPQALDVLAAASRFLLGKNNTGYQYCIPVYTQPLIGVGQLTDEELQAFGAAFLATGHRGMWGELNKGWNEYFANMVKVHPSYKWNWMGTGYLLTAAQAVSNPRSDTLPPPAVTTLKAYYDQSGKGVWLSWKAPVDNVSKRPKRYQVKYFDHGRIVEWRNFSAKGKTILPRGTQPAKADTGRFNFWTGNAGTSHWWSKDIDTISYWMAYNGGILESPLQEGGATETYHLTAEALGQLTVPLSEATFTLKSFDEAENLSAMSNVVTGISPFSQFPGAVLDRKRSKLSMSASPGPLGRGATFRISGALPGGAEGWLRIYSLQGKEAASIPVRMRDGTGSLEVGWEGTGASGGVHVARLTLGRSTLERIFNLAE